MRPPITVNSSKRAETFTGKAQILDFSVRRNEFSFDKFHGSLVIEGASSKELIFDRRIFIWKTFAPNHHQIEEVKEYKKSSTDQP